MRSCAYQVRLAFQLGSVAAAVAVTASRDADSSAGARSPRDLLVLHRNGQLALYVGNQRLFNLRLASPPRHQLAPGRPAGACDCFTLNRLAATANSRCMGMSSLSRVNRGMNRGLTYAPHSVAHSSR